MEEKLSALHAAERARAFTRRPLGAARANMKLRFLAKDRSIRV